MKVKIKKVWKWIIENRFFVVGLLWVFILNYWLEWFLPHEFGGEYIFWNIVWVTPIVSIVYYVIKKEMYLFKSSNNKVLTFLKNNLKWLAEISIFTTIFFFILFKLCILFDPGYPWEDHEFKYAGWMIFSVLSFISYLLLKGIIFVLIKVEKNNYQKK